MRHLAWSSFIFSPISMAVKTALSAWFSISMGAPKTAMMASPMNLSKVPSYLKMMAVMAVKYSLRIGRPPRRKGPRTWG